MELIPSSLLILASASIGGMLVGKLTTIPTNIFNKVRSRFNYSVAIEQNDGLFRVINSYIATKYPKECRSVIAKWDKYSKKNNPTYYQKDAFFPVKYNGKRLIISASREKMDSVINSDSLYFATIKISGFKAKREIDELLIDAIANFAIDRPRGAIGIFAKRSYEGMNEVNQIYPKPLKYLVYADNKGQKIKADIENFLGNEDWYFKRGIPYKRCYCLYGPPGTGKTSLVLSLAMELKKDVYLFDVGGLTGEDDLVRVVQSIPEGVFIVIEDIDRILEKKDLKISISSLLNFLDGPFTKKGMILFMTTNHIDKIDPAIIRDGRIDVREEIKEAGKEEIETYLDIFYENHVSLPSDIKIPISTVQEICIQNKDDILKATEKLLELKNQ